MDSIIMSAARHRLPTIYPFRSWAAAGGLVAYGPDQADQFQRMVRRKLTARAMAALGRYR
jgi:hypothetical protein